MELICVDCIVFLSLGVASLFLVVHIVVLLLHCALEVFVVFFCCMCNSVVASLCFEDFYCLFLVVCVIMLLFCHVLNIFTIVACL